MITKIKNKLKYTHHSSNKSGSL